MTRQTPSVAIMKLSKPEYIELCDRFRRLAVQEHHDSRAWINRALEAESRLAIYEPGDEPHVDAKAWMNRAVLAESQIAILRSAYEPQTPHAESE